jgi:hypothetical protein
MDRRSGINTALKSQKSALLGSRSQRVSVELAKSFNKVEDLRLMADYRGDALEFAQAQWAVEQAQLFVQGLLALKTGN